MKNAAGRVERRTSPLVDGFGRTHTYLRISVTDRCNLRCVYCMPPEGIEWRDRSEILTFEEIVRVARLFAGMGITKVRLTGGEPTVRKNIEQLVADLAAVPGIETVAMTTNGLLLQDKAAALRASGLDALNVSMDTLKRDRFQEIARRDKFDDVLAGIEAAMAAGFVPLKLNVVVMAGVNDDEILDFVEYTRARPVNVRFIEYMPFKGNHWERAGFVPHSIMMDAIRERHQLIPMRGRERSAAVARDFRIEGFVGTVSFITPLSDEFCQACSRLRLTADGWIKSCLFYPAEANIRAALRGGASDDALEEIIRSAIVRKPSGHPQMEDLDPRGDRSMSQIGG